MANIVVSAEALKLVSSYLDAPASTLKNAVKALVDGLDAIGEPWGDDQIGKGWSTIYTPGKQTAIDALNEIAKGLFDLSGDFLTMSVNYETAETANAS